MSEVSSKALDIARDGASRRARLEKISFVIITNGHQCRVQPKDWPEPMPDGWSVVETVNPPQEI